MPPAIVHGLKQQSKATRSAKESEMDGKRLNIAMLLYPGVTAQDFIGPHTILSLFADIRLCWKNTDPIATDSGIRIIPDSTFADGGPPENTAPIEKDAEVLAFLNDLATRSAYVTSVCTGSLILGAAGLLQGYKAATHWTAYDQLAAYGAVPVKERVVMDRNRVTGGGVTAGLDFGLTILAKLKGEKSAKFAQLLAEYNPAPPFNCGSPETADPDVLEIFARMRGPE